MQRGLTWTLGNLYEAKPTSPSFEIYEPIDKVGVNRVFKPQSEQNIVLIIIEWAWLSALFLSANNDEYIAEKDWGAGTCKVQKMKVPPAFWSNWNEINMKTH